MAELTDVRDEHGWNIVWTSNGLIMVMEGPLNLKHFNLLNIVLLKKTFAF